MKTLNCFYVIYFFMQLSSCYRMDIEEQHVAEYCEYRKHFTLKPTATCCASKVIIPGINLTTFWEECGRQIKGKSNTLEGIGWDMYSCILKGSSGGKDEFSLQDFSDLVTTQYPDDIKTKINEEVQKQSVPTAALTNTDDLEKIRATYYDIEKAVCEGTVGEGSYGMIDKCSSWLEEDHRAGMCCKKAYPVDVRLYSNMEPDITEKKMISLLCRNFTLHPQLMMLNGTETMEYNIMDICDFACQMHGSDEIKIEDDIIKRIMYWNFDVAAELNGKHWLPSFVHDDIVTEAKQYVQSVYSIDNTIKAMKEYTFADVTSDQSMTAQASNFITFARLPNKGSIPPDDFRLDFMRRKFDEKIIHVPILCSAYHEISALMEYALFRKCYQEVKGESKPEPEPTPEPTLETEPDSTTAAEEADS